ncbi:DUF364 domain-containing protein [Acidaminobacter hydrogenoformans]|uniref:Heavy-metal chelation domain-containing protein n=1 Tax=Acidaminobacter hydrogenoformans DSM 2784 TaxID=1120920 RepID=A0A1G5S152_9FIRM|nr:DUF364 domain-containing protein [Acidaminobacter hydrogenoformans]SCZ80016.1 hypothetical protein SAMN03080599_02051 [Acidaminobacter hydrogenoformans DSM 2784]
MHKIFLNNPFEADRFAAILEEEGIPHTVVDHGSLVFDGLYQMTMGWGHVEVPEEYQVPAEALHQALMASIGEENPKNVMPMVIDHLLAVAQPYLEMRTIKDAVIGLALMAIELDNGDLGLAYTLRESLPPGCSAFGFAQEIIGKNAYEVALMAKEGQNDVQRGVGVAVLTAGSRQLGLPVDNDRHPFFGLEVTAEDTVGMIGMIPGIAKRFAQQAKSLIVFDQAISMYEKGDAEVAPMEQQAELLPKCDIVIISGTTLINQSLDALLSMCTNARDIILVGASAPMYPEAYRGTGVSVLAGAWWDAAQKDELFKIISLAGGIGHVQRMTIKKAVRVV